VGHAEIKPAKLVEGYELVYALVESAWGRGLGTELAEAIVDYGFTELGLTEVHATVAEPNVASIGLLKKLGFRHVRDIDEDGSTVVLLTRTKADTPAPGSADTARALRQR
jgi:RimJ/RimL family protein N-acetyltransferase